jgi:hypothetical protein
MDLRDGLLARIDAYLAKTGMSATTFGRLALRDGNFVARLRAGRGLTLRTHARVDSFLRAAPARAYRKGARRVFTPDLAQAIQRLRAHRAELEAGGIAHAAVFGSVARGEARPDSDIDILIETAPARRIGLFGLTGLKRRVSELLPRADVVDRRSLHPEIAERVLAEAIDAF